MTSSLLVLLLLPFLATAEGLVSCHSCFKKCPEGAAHDPSLCECEKDYCLGHYCFAKIEIFQQENIAVIQKGCSTEKPGGQSGCQYAGRNDSIHCFCEGAYCNRAETLNSYRPPLQPLVDCCECTYSKGEDCPSDECKRTCAGNYCYMDFISLNQGCGMGVPKLMEFLRAPDYRGHLSRQATCARYVSGRAHATHGCVCSDLSGGCNVFNDMYEYDAANVVRKEERPLYEPELSYCYSVHKSGRKPLNATLFKKSSTCEGHFCFVSMTTAEIQLVSEDYDADTFEDYANPTYRVRVKPYNELVAGCMDVDDASKVREGCYTESQAGKELPLQKHCICSGHMCNYFDLISDENLDLTAHPAGDRKSRPTKTTPQRDRSQTDKPVSDQGPDKAGRGLGGKFELLSVCLIAVLMRVIV